MVSVCLEVIWTSQSAVNPKQNKGLLKRKKKLKKKIVSHLFFNHQPGATEVSGEISFTFLELLIKTLKVQISTSPQESPHSCKESPLLSPPSRGSRSAALLQKQSLLPSRAEPWRLWLFVPALEEARWVLGDLGTLRLGPVAACGVK